MKITIGHICGIAGLLAIGATSMSYAKTANTPQAPVQIGRMWMNDEYDGAEGWSGSMVQYPAGIPVEGYWENSWNNNALKRGWVGHGQKTGTYLMTTDWTDPTSTAHEYAHSYFYRSMDYSYPLEFKTGTAGSLFNYLYPGGIQEKYRWPRPEIVVRNARNSSGYDSTVIVDFFPGDGIPTFPDNAGIGPRPDPIVDPNLVTEMATDLWWRYIQGVEYRRTSYAYPYGSPHQDYVLWDISLTNNGISGVTQTAPVLTNQAVTDMIWSQAYDFRDNTAPGRQLGRDSQAEFVEPWGQPGHKAVMFWDGDLDIPDYSNNPGPDWGDPAETPWYQGHLLGNAYVVLGSLFASAGPGANYAVDDTAQPAFRLIWRERGLDFAGQPYSPTDPMMAREMLASGDYAIPMRTNYRDDPVTADVANYDPGPTVILGYGPVNAPPSYLNIKEQGWNLAFGQSVRIVQMWAAGGIDQEEGRRIGNIWNERRNANPGDPSSWMTPADIALVQTGRDTVMKAAALAYWNVNGTFAPNVSPADLNRWGIPFHAWSKPSAWNQPYNVPEAPRPPGYISIRARTVDEGGGVEVRWTTESESSDDFDTNVNDLAGYRVWRQTNSRCAPWELVAEGWYTSFELEAASGDLPAGRVFVDPNVTPYQTYWYAVTAYDDGTQNWAEPNKPLESSRWWTWTGYSPLGVWPAAAGSPVSEVSGTITTTTWRKAYEPYRVTGTITVPAGNTLTIEPGVDVLFDADVQFIVQGRLNAIGAATDSIRFLPGTAGEWGGIRISGGDSCTIVFARVSGGHPDGSGINGSGGGIFISGSGSRLRLDHAVISENEADARDAQTGIGEAGGGIYVYEGPTLDVTNCLISRNKATVGAGITISGASSTARFFECVITDNRANCTDPSATTHGGGGLYLSGAAVTLDRCLIAGNETNEYGGAIVVYYSPANLLLANCTVANNEADGGAGAIWLTAGGTASIRSSLVWGNTGPGYTLDRWSDGGSYTTTYSDVQGGFAGEGNIDADPLFVNAASGDYRLAEGSPCIDTGDPASPLDPDGSRADMGAFPYEPAYWIGLPNITAYAGDVIEYPVYASFPNAQSAELALVFDDALLSVEPNPIASHAFGASSVAPQWNVIGNTLYLGFASQYAVSLANESLVTLRFRVKLGAPAGAVATISVRPYPETNFDDIAPVVADGGIAVIHRLYGDVNGSGEVTALDASHILRYLVRHVSAVDAALADVTGNGWVSAYDAAWILMKVVGFVDLFPIEGGALPKAAAPAPRTLTWSRNAGTWTLAIDDATEFRAGEFVLAMPDATPVTVVGDEHLSFRQDGATLRIAFARALAGSSILFRIVGYDGENAPAFVESSLNEGRMTIGRIIRPVVFALAQNAPNPFNPTTTIRFGLPESGDVRLAIYDVSGRLVRMLVSGAIDAGEHAVVWDGRDAAGHEVASGVYVYRLVATDGTIVRRMVMVR